MKFITEKHVILPDLQRYARRPHVCKHREAGQDVDRCYHIARLPESQLQKDRSIAIALGLEDLCEVKAPEKKGKKGKKKTEQMQMEEAE